MNTQLAANIIGIISASISAIVAIATVAAVWVAVIAIKENQNQARKTQYGSLRPLLVPKSNVFEGGMFISQQDHPTWLNWSIPRQAWHIHNIGTGPALNIASVYYGAESYIVDGKRSDHAKDIHWTWWASTPIVPNEEVEAWYDIGSSNFYANHKHIGKHTFNAPRESLQQQYQKEPMHLARLIITYQDVFSRKHASIFDMVQNIGWQLIAFEEDIKGDLHDLQD